MEMSNNSRFWNPLDVNLESDRFHEVYVEVYPCDYAEMYSWLTTNVGIDNFCHVPTWMLGGETKSRYSVFFTKSVDKQKIVLFKLMYGGR